jgi:hypothetical protein
MIIPEHTEWNKLNRSQQVTIARQIEKQLVAESGTTRGGDGGVTSCAGAGFFLEWFILATAYFDPYSCIMNNEKLADCYPDFIIARRVFPLIEA